MERGALGRLVVHAALLTGLLLLTPWGPSASAHDEHTVGPLQLTVGWRDEPPYTGVANAVELTVVTEADGVPVSDPQAALTVEVRFGDEHVERALLPTGAPGELSASLVPTRAGMYTFHVIGTIADVDIDIASTCSAETFECVSDLGDLQFPAKDPTIGELGERLDRELERGTGDDDESSTRVLAIAALAISTPALLLGIARELRTRRSTSDDGGA